MANAEGRRSGRVTMERCAMCSVPLPAPWGTCPGCELYAAVRDALFWADRNRALATTPRAGPYDAWADPLMMVLRTSVREATNLFYLRRATLRRDLNALENQAHEVARERRHARAARAAATHPGMGGHGGGGRGATALPPLPPGWAIVWCETEEAFFYWDFANGISQWETPPRPLAPTATPHDPEPEQEPNASGEENDPPLGEPPVSFVARAPDGQEMENREYGPLRIRFASERRAEPGSWEPEPTPRYVVITESDSRPT